MEIRDDDFRNMPVIFESFRLQAAKTANRIAVVCASGKTLTFGELDHLSDMLAVNLQTRGIESDLLVGVYMAKSINYVISHLAILKAGGAFLPLNPTYPRILLSNILKEVKPPVVITEASLTGMLPDGLSALVLHDEWPSKTEEENNKLGSKLRDPKITLDNIAHVAFTSGSTGKPKVLPRLHYGHAWVNCYYHKCVPYKDKREREAINIFYEWEIFYPLVHGVTVYIIADDLLCDPLALATFFRDNHITRNSITPSLMEALLDVVGEDLPHYLKSVRLLYIGAEVVSVSLLERCVNMLPWITFIGSYASSECDIASFCDVSEWLRKRKSKKMDLGRFASTGKVVPGVSIVLLNEEMIEVDAGAMGEIYIGGVGLSPGYMNQPELSAQTFITTPEHLLNKCGHRLCKTGDLGFFDEDEHLIVNGRCDFIVKVRGYRVDTQAIEQKIVELSLASSCVVIVLGEKGKNERLAAYMVAQHGKSKAEVRTTLAQHLPSYMVPSQVNFLKSLPLRSGTAKRDKAALRLLAESDEVVDKETQPRTETERKMHVLWAEALDMRTIDSRESFFNLGGQSLMVVKLLSKLNTMFQSELTYKDFIQHPSISTLSKLLDQVSGGNTTTDVGYGDLNLTAQVEKHTDYLQSIDKELVGHFWKTKQSSCCKSVVLTGATGFLGSFLLCELLLQTKARVYCLVRPQADTSVLKRLESTLTKHKLLSSEPLKAIEKQNRLRAELTARVTALEGDIEDQYLGLDQTYFDALASEVDTVIHTAACVNMILPYQTLYEPNVMGTLNVLKFASGKKIKNFYHISTLSVFPCGFKDCDENTDMSSLSLDLVDGYSQTKWVAEQLVIKSITAGLPSTLYRLGNISGSSQTGAWGALDGNLNILQGCIRHRCAPLDWQLEMTPVDFISNVVTYMVKKGSVVSGQIYHIVDTSQTLAKNIIGAIVSQGLHIEMLPCEKWKKRILGEIADAGHKEDDLLHSLLTVLSDEYFQGATTFRRDKVESILTEMGVNYPSLGTSPALLNTYVNYIYT